MPLKDLLFSFDGRIRRSQWWAVHLSIFAGSIVLLGLIAAFAVALRHSDTRGISAAIVLAFGLFCLATFPLTVWISLAINVKRFHDQGLSGWMVLIGLVPAIGWLFYLIFLGCIDGQPHNNLYGPSPKYPERMAPAIS